jgi:hypothetical protein
MEPRRRLILYIVVSFLLGAVGGGFVGSKYAPRHDWQDRREGGSPLKEFSERLKLDERQSAIVDSILENHRAEFDTLRKSYGNAFRTHRDSIRHQIERILNDEQRKLYEVYVQEMDQRESRRRGGEPPQRPSR